MSHKGFSFPVPPLVVAVVVGFLLATTTAMPARAQSARLEALVNNATYSSTPTTTYKNANFTMLVDEVRFYSEFADAVVSESAELNFYIYSSSSSSTITAYAVAATYDPDTLNWSNQPSPGTALGSVLVTGVGWWSIDVTSYINSVAYSGDFAIFLVATSGGSTNTMRALPATDHIYIDYVAAVLTPPPLPPLHCFNFDTNLDAAGTADFALASGATVGTYAGVLDAGLAITGTGQLAATFPPMATAANLGFTVSGWWLVDSTFTEYYLQSTDSDFSFQIQGDTADIASPSGNNYNETIAIPEGWNYVGGGISATGLAHLIANTDYYTYAVSLPEATAASSTLTVQDAGRADQLMIFGYELSRENHLWLWNGGRGRSCYELLDPTAVSSIPVYPTPQYYVDLPSGGRADVYMQATGGELLIAAALILLLATIVAIILHYMAHRSAAE